MDEQTAVETGTSALKALSRKYVGKAAFAAMLVAGAAAVVYVVKSGPKDETESVDSVAE